MAPTYSNGQEMVSIYLIKIKITTKFFKFYPQTLPYGSNWGHKIADFVFLPFISFILAFKASECIKRYWETICEESR